jgi:hypothetical protein
MYRTRTTEGGHRTRPRQPRRDLRCMAPLPAPSAADTRPGRPNSRSNALLDSLRSAPQEPARPLCPGDPSMACLHIPSSSTLTAGSLPVSRLLFSTEIVAYRPVAPIARAQLPRYSAGDFTLHADLPFLATTLPVVRPCRIP